MRILEHGGKQEFTRPIIQRFGFDEAVFDDFVLIRLNHKKIQLIPDDHAFPLGSPIETPGMDFLNTRGQVAKLSTSAARLFGNLGKLNFIEMTRPETIRYCMREELALQGERAALISSRGSVLMRYMGLCLGLGFASDDDGWKIESQFPKGRKI